MKSLSLLAVWTVVLSIATQTAFSQEEETYHSPRAPKWVSERGYWMVESNVHTPERSIIYFYNNDNVLIYRENVEGIKLNLTRRRTLKRLKAVLEEAITAWEKQPASRENERLVATALKMR